jgi:indole-3-glycerol phosphate synthase
MSTDMTAEGARPPALSDAQLRTVPGVLGKIALERLGDYRAAGSEPPVPGPGRPGEFVRALRSPGLSVIAEIKRASPSQGPIANLDPASAARAYLGGGAAALSVLTEPRHFGGRLEHIGIVRSAVPLPVLRKDFTVHPAQLIEARVAGASAILLIVAVTGEQTASYLAYARALGLDALVEVHDEAELELAVEAGADVIGVNNRDLRSLEIDLGTAPRLLALARSSGFGGTLVAESGYRSRAELDTVRDLADAVLVGTSLAGSGDLAGALRRLTGAEPS